MPDKLPQVGTRLYHKVVISKQGLTEALETEFAKYGITDKLSEAKSTLDNESGWLWWKDNGISRGVAQFVLKTWLSNCSTIDDRFNPYKSIQCMAKMWSQGQWGQWDSWCLKYNVGNVNSQCRGLYPK